MSYNGVVGCDYRTEHSPWTVVGVSKSHPTHATLMHWHTGAKQDEALQWQLLYEWLGRLLALRIQGVFTCVWCTCGASTCPTDRTNGSLGLNVRQLLRIKDRGDGG